MSTNGIDINEARRLAGVYSRNIYIILQGGEDSNLIDYGDTMSIQLKDTANCSLEDFWVEVVNQARAGNNDAISLVKMVSNYANRQQEALSSAFIEPFTRKDLPTTCKRCKKVDLPNDLHFKGRKISFLNTVSWFDSDCGWTIQLELVTPFPRYNLLSYDNEHEPRIRVGEFMCPSCKDEYMQAMDELLSDL